jgi:hypothetical protein
VRTSPANPGRRTSALAAAGDRARTADRAAAHPGAAAPRHPLHRSESVTTIYQPGQRITLVHTSDPYTDLRPGDLGTVRSHDVRRPTVHIDWDNGSGLSMCLDAGDRITPAPHIAAAVAPSGHADAWTATLARLRADGVEAGRGIADWWAQDTLGGRATGDIRAAARRILAGIDDGDPAVLDALPTSPHRSGGATGAPARSATARPQPTGCRTGRS